MLPLLTYEGQQTDESMTLTFGGWQVGELHCTHGTSSSFDHSVWPQLSSLFKTIQDRVVTESCEEAVPFSTPTAISNILISLNLASWNRTLFLHCCFQAMIKINADKAADCVQGVSALCSFPLHICHNSARNTNQKGELRELTSVCWRKYAVKIPKWLKMTSPTRLFGGSLYIYNNRSETGAAWNSNIFLH